MGQQQSGQQQTGQYKAPALPKLKLSYFPLVRLLFYVVQSPSAWAFPEQ